MSACVGSTGRGLLRDLWSFEDEDDSASSKRPSEASSLRSPNPLLLIQTHDSDSDDDTKAYGAVDVGLRALDLVVSPSASTVLKEGWLVKRGHNWHTWKTRWFVLYRDARLVYYRNPKLKKVKGCLRLDDGIVKVQFADTYQTKRKYSFQVVKGYYVLFCSCTTKVEADEWVHALRRVRTQSPSDTEGPVSLTSLVANETSIAAKLASKPHASTIDRQIELFRLRATTTVAGNNPMTPTSLLRFISELENQIMQSIFFSNDDDTRLAVRYYIEDKVFLPLIELFYSGVNRHAHAPSPTHLQKLRNLPPHHLNPSDATDDWSFAINSLSTIDTVSLPSHKLWVLLETIAWIDETLRATPAATPESRRCVLSYVLVHAAIEDLAVLAQLLQWTQLYLPRCGHINDNEYFAHFVDALAWLQRYDGSVGATSIPALTLPFSTPEIGIQLSAVVSDRGARVASIKKHSQASLCPALTSDLVLLGINETLVLSWTLLDIVDFLRAAPLPKRLVFVSDADYEKLLATPDFDAFLFCLCASRGDVLGLQALVDEHGDAPLHRVCKWDRGLLLASLPWLPASHDTPLHAAVSAGQAHMVVELLDEHRVNPTVCNAAGQTPLHVLQSHIPEIAPTLFGHGGQRILDCRDPRGYTPLMLQCSRGNVEGVVTLLGLGADLNAVAWSNGTTAFCEAVAAGDLSLVDVCLLRGANVRHANLQRETPLHIAARAGQPKLIQRLLVGGALISTQNRLGMTPAAVLLQAPPASSHVLLDCLALLATPSVLEIPDLWGRRLVHYASQLEVGLKDVMELLLGRGANGHVVDLFGDAPREYRRHPKDHGVQYAPPTAYMRHLSVTLTTTADGKLQLQSGRLEDLLTYLVADKSMRLHDMFAFVLNSTTYMDMASLLVLLKAKTVQSQKGLKKAWSVANFQRDPNCGALFFLALAAYLHPGLALTPEFTDCLGVIGTSTQLAVYVSGLERYYRAAAPSSLYADLYAHMLGMYGAKPSYDGARARLGRLNPMATSALDLARQCTLVSHAVFAQIPIRQLLQPKCNHTGFLAARHWFQHLSALVINYVLLEESPQARADVIAFFVEVAVHCFETFQNFDSFIAILYALQSTAVFRLKRTMSYLSPATAETLAKYQVYTQNGSRDMNRVMKTVKPPCMPYIGLYLQNVVGLHELPKYEEEMIVNFNRLRLLGSLAQDLLSYQSTPYPMTSSYKMEALLHVDLAFPTDEARYERSHAIESRASIDALEAETSPPETPRRSSISRDSVDSAASLFPRLRFSSFSSKRDRTSSVAGLVWV
ncbi:hypothetical protein SPRG_08532 [Saprolegnia parasitica CBS 223.65]|uniref:Uncharacterized protein n=1 Tax=Saprolegnia parasitica (strain CBS 223.65) TaxID=695850 RepID=A0A067CI37_SAPPC|nr:hypothetical protein SPRG_08532 [Saprolegnia parasitica CBS 223.65]KDO26171.1 hypothetical protein SPRG_08532 [Saprolegnia parasitica CBS 223.65]|eukprot:XP_012203164.1 hypothetical protein SPRG_08532 [Saprolegnia parasitica CBS 223.65]